MHLFWPELEAECLRMIADGDYEGTRVADRADAMVRGLTELIDKAGILSVPDPVGVEGKS